MAGGCSMKGDVVCVYSTGPKQPGRGPPAGGHQLAVCRLTGGDVGTHGAARQWTTNPPPLGRRDGQRAGSALRAAAPRGQAAASVPHLCCRSAAHPPGSVLREQARPQSPSFRSRTSLPPTSSTACSLPRQNIRSPRGHRDDPQARHQMTLFKPEMHRRAVRGGGWADGRAGGPGVLGWPRAAVDTRSLATPMVAGRSTYLFLSPVVQTDQRPAPLSSLSIPVGSSDPLVGQPRHE